ncbi:MAG: nitrate- and nitrite sensing domain-containing protein [Pseudonocardia sp.]|nr:nitrate- and nitrite sensing domain-containing protein [Pseudonocardia sp.]
MTSTERHPTWSERLNPRNWNLATKLIAVGLVPTLLALVLGVLRIADQAGVAQDLGTGNRLLEIRQQLSVGADALRTERNAAVLFVAGNRTGDRAAVEAASAGTDAALDAARQALADPVAQGSATTTALQQADGGFTQLPVLRTATLNSPIRADDVLNQYTDIIQRADVLEHALLRQAFNTDAGGGLADALSATTSASEALALQHTAIAGALVARQLGDQTRNAITSSDVAYRNAFADYQVSLRPEQLARYGNFATDGANVAREQIRTAVLATPVGDPPVGDGPAWDAAYQQSAQVVEASAAGVENELTTSSAAAQEQASNQAGVNSVILMLGLLIGIAIIALLARSLIRSLRILRRSALDVAERRLPAAVESMRSGNAINAIVEPVPLSGRDEVGQVARAFDAVHGQAVRLAADQAALQANVSNMFVNLSRRSQALVERQLQLIEQLESNEQDPDQLSNLFQLDHLATRMRRNSENLLVLAGTDLAKRNVAPVPVVDVLRAAVSEIEQYQRIVVQTPPTATIAGRAASDIVHLLAELLDNATNFSPPDSQVVMSTIRLDDGSLLVEIADRGVGMADSELSEANQRLSGPNAVDVSASRRMGLFVVGRLATRHGLAIRLGSTPIDGGGGGLTATVTVPSALVPSAEPAQPRRALAPAVPQVPQQTPNTPERPGDGAAQAARNGSRAEGPGQMPDAGRNTNGQNGNDPNGRRPQTNGTGRTGSLSSLVAGSDGPMSPAGAFEQAPRPETPKAPSSLNGANGLPTRKPGSALRRNDPSAASSPSPFDAFERPDAADRPSAAERLSAFDKTRRDTRPGEVPDAPGEATFGGIAAAGAAGAAAGRVGRGRQDAPEDRPAAAPEDGATAHTDGVPEPAADAVDTSDTSASPVSPASSDETEDTDDTDTRANPVVQAGPGTEPPTEARADQPEPLGGPWPVESLRGAPGRPSADPREGTANGSVRNGTAPHGTDAAEVSPAGDTGKNGVSLSGLPKREPGRLSRSVPRPGEVPSAAEAANASAAPRDVAETPGAATPATDGTATDGTATEDTTREDTTLQDSGLEGAAPEGTAGQDPSAIIASDPSTPDGEQDTPDGALQSGAPGDDESRAAERPAADPDDDRSGGSEGSRAGGAVRDGVLGGPLPVRTGPGADRPGPDGPRTPGDIPAGNALPALPGAYRPAEQPVRTGASAFVGPQDRPGDEQDALPVRGGPRYGQNGPGQNGPGQNAPGQNGPGQNGPGQNGPGRPGPEQFGPAGLPRRRPQPPVSAQAPAESLFAPNVAGAGAPAEQLRRPGGFDTSRTGPPPGAPAAPFGAGPSGPPQGSGPAGLTGPAGAPPADFDMGQTTPIFEEIASAWFRSNRSVPVRWEEDQQAGGPNPGAPNPGAPNPGGPNPGGQAPGSQAPGPQGPGSAGPRQNAPLGAGAQAFQQGRGPEAPVPSGASAPFGTPDDGGRAGLPRRAPGGGLPRGGERQPFEVPVGARAEVGRAPARPERPAPERDEEFATSADEGWRAAESTAADAERSAEVTTAGLPKRRPRARLVPGSAAGSAVLAAPSAPSRSAEVIRGRLASYQQGVRQGRESRLRRQAGPPLAGGPARTTEQQEES